MATVMSECGWSLMLKGINIYPANAIPVTLQRAINKSSWKCFALLPLVQPVQNLYILRMQSLLRPLLPYNSDSIQKSSYKHIGLLRPLQPCWKLHQRRKSGQLRRQPQWNWWWCRFLLPTQECLQQRTFWKGKQHSRIECLFRRLLFPLKHCFLRNTF